MTETPARRLQLVPEVADEAEPAQLSVVEGVDPAVHGRKLLLRMAVKRTLDLLVSVPALIVLAPLMLLLGVLVRATSPGPAIFRQQRIGRHGNEFTMLKFRSMEVGTPDDIHRAYVSHLLTAPAAVASDGLYKLADDPRVTGFGRFLRRTSLDELPQLLNVVRGDMSLVGPRPVLAWEAEMFSPHERARFALPPGITGLWQVSGRATLTMRDALALDVDYVRRQRLVLDVWILIRTIPALLAYSRTR